MFFFSGLQFPNLEKNGCLQLKQQCSMEESKRIAKWKTSLGSLNWRPLNEYWRAAIQNFTIQEHCRRVVWVIFKLQTIQKFTIWYPDVPTDYRNCKLSAQNSAITFQWVVFKQKSAFIVQNEKFWLEGTTWHLPVLHSFTVLPYYVGFPMSKWEQQSNL